MKRYFLLHYIGQYLFLSILFIIGWKIYFSNFPIKQKVGPIIIKSKSNFNSSSIPFIIAHFSDSHINSFNPSYGNNFEMCLNRSLIYQPNVFLHTGDIVDNFCTDTRPKYGHQCPGDFIEFDNIFRKYRQYFNFSLISAGNHDMFGIYSFDSPNFNFLKATKDLIDTPMANYEEFLVSNYKIKVNDGYIINFISLNPFTFPTAHPIFMYFAHTWKYFLNRFESIIEKIPRDEKIIFYSHYPQSSFTSITNPILSQKSSKGKSIGELIEQPNTMAFISGHVHVSDQQLEHHGITKKEGNIVTSNSQYLESIGFDTKLANLFEIVSIDNGKISFHKIDPKNQNKCIITYPIPSNQTISHSYYDDELSSLRILCFNDQPLKIEIHGDIEGKTITNIKKLKENVYLYEYPLLELFEADKKKEKSSDLIQHHLTFEGEWKGEIKFYSSGIIPVFKEQKNHEYSRILVTRFVLPLVLIYLIIVTAPISSKKLKNEELLYFDFLTHNVTDKTKLFKYRFLTYTGLCLRLKIQRLNKNYRIVLFCAVLWPIFLPLSLMETEGHYGFIWAYGYFIGGSFRFSEHGQDYEFFYYLSIVFPIVLISASIGAKIPFFGLGGLESFLLFSWSVMFIAHKLWYEKLVESVGPYCEYVSVYSLGMIILYPLMVCTYTGIICNNKCAKDTEWYSEEMTLVRSIPI